MDPIYLFGNRYLQSPVRKMLFMHAFAGGTSIVEDTATGNPLSFLTDLARPLKSCVATWQPHQSGSGDPSPENVRPVVGMDGVNVWHTGKNVFPDTNLNRGYINSSGEFSSQLANALSDYIPYVYGQKVTIYLEDSVNDGVYSVGIAYYDKDKQFLGRNSQGGHEIPYTFPLYSGTGFGYIRIWINRDNEYYTVDEFASFGLYAQFGDDFTAYEPYSGTSYSVAFPAVGRNLFDVSTVGFTPSKYIKYEDGTLGSWGSSWNASGFMPVDENTDYVLQCSCNGLSDAGIAFYDDNKEFISGVPTASITGVFTFTTPTNAKYLRFSCVTPDTNPAQIEYGSTPHPYEPYTNTVYGGTLDLVSGVLTATYMQKVSDGSVADDWVFGESGGLYRAIMAVSKFDYPPKASSTANLRTNYLKNASDQQMCNAFIGSTSNFLCYVPDGITTKEDWLAYLAEHNLQIVYELAEPVTLATLSPTQITALIGNNTMWADADSLSVTYLKKG